MAIGILMAIRRIGQDEAFDLLRRVSQRTNRKLREIADEVVHTGQLPDATPR
jgi:AmiR/NasT family two-component response regulator